MRYASLFKKLVLQTVIKNQKIQVDELRSTVTTKSETAKNAKKKSYACRQCEKECKEPQLNKLN